MSKFSHNQASHAVRVAFLVGGCFASAGAKDAHTAFTVGATVRAVANLELAAAPSTLRILPRDVARGYVDAPQSTQLSIISNSQHGYVLDIMSVAPLFTALTVQGLDTDVALGAEGGALVMRGAHQGAQQLKLRFRFMLAPGLGAGDYPWPLRLAVRPLESI